MKTSRAYQNGADQENFLQTLVELPGLAACYLQRLDESVNLLFLWAGGVSYDRSFHIILDELPGPETYHLLYTWDADQGICDGYLNGSPMRCPETRFPPWEIAGRADTFRAPPGANTVYDLEVLPHYLPPAAALKRVPAELLGQRSELVGTPLSAAAIDLADRRGDLLYDNPMTTKADLEDWVMEGPGRVTFEEGSLVLRSKTPAPAIRGQGHLVYWCPEDFPDRFVAEWEFRPLKEHGLSLVFFAAQGKNDEDLFDPRLPSRADSHFKHYTHGAIQSYHLCYFVNLPKYQTGHPTCNLRKNTQFYNLAQGPIAVRPGEYQYHRLYLIKDGNHIQFIADGRVCIDFIDPGNERWGRVLGGGKIGFRQMAVTEGAYRRFRVWELR